MAILQFMRKEFDMTTQAMLKRLLTNDVTITRETEETTIRFNGVLSKGARREYMVLAGGSYYMFDASTVECVGMQLKEIVIK